MKFGCLAAVVLVIIGLIVIIALFFARGDGSDCGVLCAKSGSSGPMIVRLRSG